MKACNLLLSQSGMSPNPFVPQAIYKAKVDYQTSEYWGFYAGEKFKFIEAKYAHEDKVTVYLFRSCWNGNTKAWLREDASEADWRDVLSQFTKEDYAAECTSGIKELAANYKSKNVTQNEISIAIESRLLPEHLHEQISLLPPELLTLLRDWVAQIQVEDGRYRNPIFINSDYFPGCGPTVDDIAANVKRFEAVVDLLRSHFGMPALR